MVHGEEADALGDADYQSVDKREEMMARYPGLIRGHNGGQA